MCCFLLLTSQTLRRHVLLEICLFRLPKYCHTLRIQIYNSIYSHTKSFVSLVTPRVWVIINHTSEELNELLPPFVGVIIV